MKTQGIILDQQSPKKGNAYNNNCRKGTQKSLDSQMSTATTSNGKHAQLFLQRNICITCFPPRKLRMNDMWPGDLCALCITRPHLHPLHPSPDHYFSSQSIKPTFSGDITYTLKTGTQVIDSLVLHCLYDGEITPDSSPKCHMQPIYRSNLYGRSQAYFTKGFNVILS